MTALTASAVCTIVGVLAPLALVAGQTRSQPPVFSSRVEQVRVDVLVTERGKPVTGLQASDFELFDEDVRQQITLVASEQAPVDIVLALDSSRSVRGERLRDLREAAADVLRALRSDDRAALLSFSHIVTQGVSLTSDVESVLSALNRIEPSGDTSLRDAVFAAMTMAEPEAGRSLLLVFSDGVDTTSWLTPPAVMDTARNRDVVIYGISRIDSAATGFLGDVAALTGGRILQVGSTRSLSASFTEILDEFRHRYVISYSPKNVARAGWHRLRVRVKRPETRVLARSGYTAAQ